MKIIRTVKEMQRYATSQRRQNRRIAFVPTMGCFHEGHLNLMRTARHHGDCVVVSLYVNPTQFSPSEDFAAYPRDLERDLTLADGVDVEVLFTPGNAEMYPEGHLTTVQVEGLTENLCGISRPHHFRGVTTICAKLFNVVRPHIAVFGRKDFQQYVIIKKMIQDLNMNIEIIGMPTTREADGLAMSSRNTYLKPAERISALSLSRGLREAKGMYEAGEREAQQIIAAVEAFINSQPFTRIDYCKICSAVTLQDIPRVEGEAVIALAVWIGKTRLIDNYVFGEDLPL
ncbi:MAG: pantoate--beta-alanine ligase [Syntrophaceae bacterium]|nr:pantoate--beta-alanine ligase [Syntrophaceae bacterium]